MTFPVPGRMLLHMVKAILTEHDLAEEIGLSLKVIQKWRRLGGGPPYMKLGGSVRYRRSDVEAWLTASTRNHLPDGAA